VSRGHPPDVCEGDGDIPEGPTFPDRETGPDRNADDPLDLAEVTATDELIDRIDQVDYTDPDADPVLRLLAAYRAQHRDELLSDLMVNQVGGWDTPNGRNLLQAIRKRANFGSPGDFNRCRAFLATKGVTGDKADRICASAHHEILGKWPAEGH
jgi:hypothetical protein